MNADDLLTRFARRYYLGKLGDRIDTMVAMKAAEINSRTATATFFGLEESTVAAVLRDRRMRVPK